MVKHTGMLNSNGARRRATRKPIVLRRGTATVTIRYEKPRDNRKPWRLEWVENGQDCSEMHDTMEDATTYGETKLATLSSGSQTLTREEIDNLFGFKTKVEEFEKRIAHTGRTLEQVLSDVIAAQELLPGWMAAAMAQFIRTHHGVANPMTVNQVKTKFIAFMRSGYKRNYVLSYIVAVETGLGEFAKAFGDRLINQIQEEEILGFINSLRVKPDPKGDSRKVDSDGLVPAKQKSKSNLFSILKQMFLHAKKVLKALPARLETAVEMLDSPQYTTPEPQVYTPAELRLLFGLLPDQEGILWVGLQAFAGLRPGEAAELPVKDIRKDASGNYSFVLVRQEIGKKDSTGSTKVRTRKAPITAPLAAILNSTALPNAGRVFPSKAIEQRVAELASAGNFVWKHDALRHSFISYRLPVVKSRPQVAYESGHEIPSQIEHYEGLVEECDVPKWWNFTVEIAGRPFTLNWKIMGMKSYLEYQRAKQRENGGQSLPKAA